MGFLLIVLAGSANAQRDATLPTVQIGFVADERNDQNETFKALIERELLELARNDFNVLFPDRYSLIADGTLGGVAAQTERLLRDSAVDVAVTLGFLASQIAAQRAPWPRPVVASFVLDPELQGLPFERGTSGIQNLTYVTIPAAITRDLQTFRNLVPFSRVEFLFYGGDQAEQIGEETGFFDFLERLEKEASELGFELHAVSARATAEATLAHIPQDAEAVYMLPLNQMPTEELDALIAELNARRIPTFGYDRNYVERGVLAALSADDRPRLARRVALNVHRILLGDDPSTFPVAFLPSEDLTINMATVRQLGFAPPLVALLGANRLFEEEPLDANAPALTLEEVMAEALEVNLSLAIQDQVVASGAEDVRLARSNLLPTVSTGAAGSLIDRSIAEASAGQNGQYSFDGNVILEQVIFSESANANLSIQRSVQESREWDRDAAELDVVLEAAEAFLNVLRAKTVEEVRQENLELTRASLRLARVREQIGSAGPGERLRLESELATRRSDRVAAYGERYAAELALNQVLNRPLEEPFQTADADDASRELIEGHFLSYVLGDVNKLFVVGDFFVDEALRHSPELQSLTSAIEAQDRQLKSTRRAFYLPTVALQGMVSTNLYKGGAGSELPEGITAPRVTSFPWSLGLSVSIPLFEGTARQARREQAVSELARLELQRDLLEQQIEQNVRIQLRTSLSSFVAVHESEVAADAARRSLELVTDSYAEGVVGVVDLLQAQNSALVTDLRVANAVYDHIVNLIRVERAIGFFEALEANEGQADLRERLQAFLESVSNQD